MHYYGEGSLELIPGVYLEDNGEYRVSLAEFAESFNRGRKSGGPEIEVPEDLEEQESLVGDIMAAVLANYRPDIKSCAVFGSACPECGMHHLRLEDVTYRSEKEY